MKKNAMLSCLKKQAIVTKKSLVRKQICEVEQVVSGFRKLDTNIVKGNACEMLGDIYFDAYDAESLLQNPVTSLGASGHHGIDGIYRIMINGVIFYIISDAKYHTSRLINTRTGRQLSNLWIDPRLDSCNMSRTTNSRLQSAVGKKIADQIVNEILLGKALLVRVVFHVDPDFTIAVHLVDERGYITVRDIDL